MKKRTAIVACGVVYLALIPCLGFAGRLESLAKAMQFVRSQIRSAPCGSRYYGTGDSGHWAVQCSQQIAAALAILSETPADELKRAGFRETPEELRELALSLFLYSFHTHVTGDADATDGARWGKTWISVLGLERSSGGLNLLLSRMSDDDRARLKRLLTFESDFRLNEYEITAGLTKGNKPESNLWNAGIMFRTAADYPDLPQAEAYREKARRMMLNGIVNELDRDEPWYVGPQFTRNWSLDHHGYMNVGYSYECFSNLAFLHFCMKDRGRVPPPETMHRVRELWETVKRFTFPDGRLDRIGGDTRVRYGYCQIFAIQAWYFIADVLGDPDALRFAREYEKKIFAEQDANPDGSYFGKRLASVRKASVSYYDRLEADVFFTLAYAHHWERRYGLKADDRPVEIVREEQWSDDYHRSMFIRNPKSYRSVTFRAQAGIGLRNGVPTVVCAPTADSSLAEWWGNGIGFVGCQREHDWFEGTPDEWPTDAFAMRSFKDGCGMAFEESFSCPVAEQRVFAEGEKPYRFGRRDTKVVALGDGVTMAVRDRVSIDRTIALEHGFRGVNWLVPNDVMNGFKRTFTGEGRRLTVDDRLSVISVKGGDLRRTPVEIPFNHNFFAHPLASLKAESIYSAGTTEPVVTEAGMILFDVVYLVSAVGDEQGEGLMASAAWDEASDALSLVGADGRSRRLDLSLGTVPPPEATGRKLVERFLSREPEDWNYHPGQKLMYWVVCAWYGAMDFAERIGDRELLKRLTGLFEPFFGKKAERCPDRRHVDYSMFGALPLSVYRRTGDLRCKEMGLGYADRQWMPKGGADDKWLEQGFTPETRLWMDDMHQITILQLEAFKVTGDRKYADRAAKEMVLYLDRLQNPDGLFYHTVETPFVWGRGDGWMAAGMAMLMKKLPPDQPELPRIMSGYRKMMDALLKTQRPDGLWGQLVGDPDIWAETSCSAMFAYAFAVGVNQGWLDRKTYGPAVRRAYRGLCAKLTAEGDLTEVCVGTNAKNNRLWYVDRPRKAGDLHGQAPFIWLCAELMEGEIRQ